MNLRHAAFVSIFSFAAASACTSSDAPQSDANQPPADAPQLGSGDLNTVSNSVPGAKAAAQLAAARQAREVIGRVADARTRAPEFDLGMPSENDPAPMPELPAAPPTITVDDGALVYSLPGRMGVLEDPAKVRTNSHEATFTVTEVRWVTDSGRVLGTLSSGLDAATRADEGDRSVYGDVGEGMDLVFTRKVNQLVQELVLDAAPAAPAGAQSGEKVYLEVVERVTLDSDLALLDGTIHRRLPARFDTELPLTMARRMDNAWAPVMNFSYPEAFDADRNRAGREADVHYAVAFDAQGAGTISTRVAADYLLDANTRYPVAIDPHTNIAMPPPRIWAINVAPTYPGSMTGVVMMVASNVFNAPLEIQINWGDGETTTLTSAEAQFLTHTYTTKGNYNVEIIVCDDIEPARCDSPDGGPQLIRIGTGTVDCSFLDDECSVGVFDAAENECDTEPRPEGARCEDGDFCTVNDTCDGDGECESGDDRDCSGEDDQCNTGECNEDTDACEADPVDDDTRCDDGLFCTDGDSCQAGVCQGGDARDCTGEDDQCNTGFCNENTDACEKNPAPHNGDDCSDELFCTVGDTCNDGTCSGDARDCSAAGDQCNDGVCNEDDNACEPRMKQNGTPCNDGLFCTPVDTCTLGSCGGAQRDCSAAGDDCNVGVCDDNNDSCEPQPANDGELCDDGDPGTVNDTCGGGVCGGVPTVCNVDDDCDDNNPCTNDSCDGGVRCVNDPFPDNTPCSDNDVCNGLETCQAGTCEEGTDLQCNLAGQCEEDTCDPVTGCGTENTDAGALCDDGQVNTINDQCDGNGNCAGTVVGCLENDDCNDDNECTVDSCGLDNECDFTEIPGCCLDAGDCGDADACTADACVNNSCENVAIPDCCVDDAQCADSSVCTADTCVANVCVNAPIADCCEAAVECDDGQVCTIDQCLANVCVNVPDASCCEDNSECNDGNACTADVCVNNACQTTEIPDCCNDNSECGDDNQCTTDQCVANACVNAPIAGCCTDNEDCNDSSICTTDQCLANVCINAPISGCCETNEDCNDGNICTVDACVAGACTVTAIPGCCSQNSDCADGDNCTQDICTAGTCSNPGVSCDDGVQCTQDGCNPGDGSCLNIPRNDLCENADFCDGTETCDPVNDCQSSGDPCGPGETCNEATNSCDGGAGGVDPDTIASIGDSISRGFGATCTDGSVLGATGCLSAGNPPGDQPGNSWTTGDGSLVDSVAQRYAAEHVTNFSAFSAAVTGAVMGDAVAQAQNICAQNPIPGTVTFLLGQNDVCSSSITGVGQLPTTGDLAAELEAALDVLAACLDNSATVTVYSMLRVDLLHAAGIAKTTNTPCPGETNVNCPGVWGLAGICPIVTQSDDNTRTLVGAAVDDYNTAFFSTVAAFNVNPLKNPNGVTFVSDWTGTIDSGHVNESFGNSVFGACEIDAADCFHPSIRGQEMLACRGWDNHPSNPSGGSANCDPPSICGDGLISGTESCETDADCAAGDVCNATCACETPGGGGDELAECTIEFDSTCPDSGAECGLEFDGPSGGTCTVEGKSACYSSGIRAFKVNAGETATIRSADGASTFSRVDFYFATDSVNGTASIEFFSDINCTQSLGAETSAPGACAGPGGAMQSFTSIDIGGQALCAQVSSVDAASWIDSFTVNPEDTGGGGGGENDLPNCRTNFDDPGGVDCPSVANPVCGATFSNNGSGTCEVVGIGACYDSGFRAYSTNGGETTEITFAGDVNALTLMFSGTTAAESSATIECFDSNDNLVGAGAPNASCEAFEMPGRINIAFPAPAVRCTVASPNGRVWMDSFEVNP